MPLPLTRDGTRSLRVANRSVTRGPSSVGDIDVGAEGGLGKCDRHPDRQVVAVLPNKGCGET